MPQKHSKKCHRAVLLLSALISTNAFMIPKQTPHPPSSKTGSPKFVLLPFASQSRKIVSSSSSSSLYASSPNSSSSSTESSSLTTQKSTTEQDEKEFDKLLEAAKLRQAVNFFQSHPDLELTRERWNSIFNAIEESTAQAEQDSINTRNNANSPPGDAFPLLSKSRMDMSDMYQTLKRQGHLRLFGSIDKTNMPANGSHTVRPSMLEQVSALSMKALTPQPTNTLLYAGFALALLEGFGSIALGLNLNFLFFVTVFAALTDRILLNGAISETIVKILSPETQPKITRHEAGHFLCAYLLGCPVEGYVLSAWAALNDARFGSRGVGAGTSFFDPKLSTEMTSSKITRSSIDRYSIIVMAGIAAEAVNYGRADGGAGDEMALIAFLSNLNGAPSSNPAWNDVTIRNQARWGALQAVLLIREYRECYDALVDTLERGGSLGDCIYAIEKAGRDSGKIPLEKPLGYIVEKPGGLEEVWVKELPTTPTPTAPTTTAAAAAAAQANGQQDNVVTAKKVVETKPLDPEDSLETLKKYKEMVQAQLKEIDEKLGGL